MIGVGEASRNDSFGGPNTFGNIGAERGGRRVYPATIPKHRPQTPSAIAQSELFLKSHTTVVAPSVQLYY